MADTKCYIPNQLLDLDQIQQEAQHRWLRPAEICEILTNYHKFQLRPSPPVMPPAGSLFLFDRKVIRYFRKDGHRWRKKKDGKIVKEAHEKLKAGSVDVLHCYYAHGEDNENFQRRSYWMLDKQYENIVLVHYREVKEGYKSSFSRGLNPDSRTLLQNSQSSEQTPHTSYGYDMNSVDKNEQSVSSISNNEHSSQDFGIDSFTTDLLSYKLTDARLDSDTHSQDFLNSGNGFFSDHEVASQVNVNTEVINLQDNDAGGLKKMDSFGRWMCKELGGEFDDSLMASDSGVYWNAIETETGNNKTEVSSLSHHMQLNTSPVGPSLAQEQLFTITDFAPDWAYLETETKILITGNFLGDKKRMNDIKWCCMFGEIEVAAELLTENAIRCQVPLHAAGRIPFYITCSNRLACSEVREFEYIDKSTRLTTDHHHHRDDDKTWDEEEFGLVIRLSKLLSLGVKLNKWLDCKVVDCEKCKMKDVFDLILRNKEWCSNRITKELLIQNLLKDKLYERLVYEVHEACEGLRVLDEKGQGVIHLAGALGYEWAVAPITATGVSPNFRDSHGRTALHWASLYGREETVVALVKFGAYAGAVDDPTPMNPGGQTAADLASSKGHKGIAGYLAETDLTTHLSALSVKEKDKNGVKSEVLVDDDDATHSHSLKGSLAAVRRSAHAAALIQDAFRTRSFNQRQQQATKAETEELVAIASSSSLQKVKKTRDYEDYLHLNIAASKIQQKYRGWKGRNEFLKMRERVVKIQAHFRGHKVRKHYKKVVWSVGIVEKAILRWRRKSRGLRGFRPELRAPESESESEYDFLRIGRRQKYVGVEKALARVHSMARNPEGQEQYMRLVGKFEKLSHEHEDSSSSK
ncbi:calmodulin-binding transcription activator 3 isoform X1 [Lactuca sativa]|uniref:calmodulin-binding transcription activator 3 isoform X1 n=1 Tax=Lactuca sativa TaxID=4236 RepID=UPI000CD92957|nr:calmodulin-binding transcription activator 3 isoform X1 [Lactuca sativa]